VNDTPEPDDLHAPGVRVRTVWGLAGLHAVAPHVDAVVIVDVLSFSTACAVAREAGAEVVPHDPDREPPSDVRVAGPRSKTEPSLSPVSLVGLPPHTRIVIPSPNGSRLMARSRWLGLPATTACLRDRHGVAGALDDVERIGIVAAGERWSDGSIRFALEDWLGAGALAAALTGPADPESIAARAAFEAHRHDLVGALSTTPSGRELLRRGFPEDVDLAAQLDAS